MQLTKLRLVTWMQALVSRTVYMNNTSAQGRSQGGPGVPVTPPLLQAFFNQTTYNRWRKCHDDNLAIVKKLFF